MYESRSISIPLLLEFIALLYVKLIMCLELTTAPGDIFIPNRTSYGVRLAGMPNRPVHSLYVFGQIT